MKTSCTYLFTLTFLFFLNTGDFFAQDSGSNLSGQDILGGAIKYDQFIIMDYTTLKSENPGWNDWISTLPKSQKSAKVLYFNSEYSLYEQDLSVENKVLNPKLALVNEKISYVQPPKPELKKVYIDTKKNKKTELIELMTRYFLIEDEIESQAWKPGSEQRKIQGYICQEATQKKGEETITAWFTPNIPISFGPDNYGGLPGLILAIDINGENVFLATSIDLTTPRENNLTKPKGGKKISQKVFDDILAEKIKEFEESKSKTNIIRRD